MMIKQDTFLCLPVMHNLCDWPPLFSTNFDTYIRYFYLPARVIYSFSFQELECVNYEFCAFFIHRKNASILMPVRRFHCTTFRNSRRTAHAEEKITVPKKV